MFVAMTNVGMEVKSLMCCKRGYPRYDSVLLTDTVKGSMHVDLFLCEDFVGGAETE